MGSRFYKDHLTDIPLDQLSAFDFSTATEMLETCPIVEKEGKQIIKGGRLYLYPTYMKLYRTSRGVQQPTIIKNATDEDVSAAVEDLPVLYETMYELTLEEDKDFKNVIRYKQYNKTVVAAERHCRKTDGAVCRRQPRLFGASRIGLRSGRRPLLGEIKPLHHPGQFVPYGHQ